ncbi:penicillin-binding protein 2 [Candidatus Uhrbacteria bacterium]|nr:penicillin-binding protein 2 [Candidatus Uhrbacteria bacterium]
MNPGFFFRQEKGATELFVHTDRPVEWVESSVDVRDNSNRQYLGVTISSKLRAVAFFIIILTLVAFFIRSAQLQIIQGEGLFAISQNNKIREYIIQAHRGAIFDRTGRRLVSNAANFTVYAYPKELPSDPDIRSSILQKLSKNLGMDRATIDEKISEGAAAGSMALLKDHVSRTETLVFTAEFAGISGIEIIPEEIRNYETESAYSLSHVLGYTGRITKEEFNKNRDEYYLNDTIGKDGIELSYESYLRGTYGKKQVEIDALGNQHDTVAELKARDGSDLILTIDFEMQKKAEEVLSAALHSIKKKKGVLIASDPRNGEILAFVSLPAYDNNAFNKRMTREEYQSLANDLDQPLFPRGLRGDYPSGSTIKMIVAAAALSEGVITPTTSVLSRGGIRIGQWNFPDWKAGGHGHTNVIKALAESVNTFFYYIGGGFDQFQGLGIEKLITYFHQFGLGSKTGIDLPNEAYGFVPSPTWKLQTKKEQWYIGDTYHIAIGQGDLLVSPLQVNLYTAYFANGGMNFIPHVVKNIQQAGSMEHAVEIAPRMYKKDILPDSAMQTVREGLRQAVLSGSARRLSLLRVPAAGKTGTAQWQTGKDPHAWFTGWAPFDDPDIVVTVLIEEGEEGSKSAISAAHDFFTWYFDEHVPLTLDKDA